MVKCQHPKEGWMDGVILWTVLIFLRRRALYIKRYRKILKFKSLTNHILTFRVDMTITPTFTTSLLERLIINTDYLHRLQIFSK